MAAHMVFFHVSFFHGIVKYLSNTVGKPGIALLPRE